MVFIGIAVLKENYDKIQYGSLILKIDLITTKYFVVWPLLAITG